MISSVVAGATPSRLNRQKLGVRGVLVQMAKRRQIIELRCEMPSCYCHKGRAHFDPKSHPPGPWEPSPDHYPRLKSDGGHLDPWNVRLSHVLCNREDYGWRMRIRRMLEKGMSLDEIAEKLNHKGVRAPHGRGKRCRTPLRVKCPSRRLRDVRSTGGPSPPRPTWRTRLAVARIER